MSTEPIVSVALFVTLALGVFSVDKQSVWESHGGFFTDTSATLYWASLAAAIVSAASLGASGHDPKRHAVLAGLQLSCAYALLYGGGTAYLRYSPSAYYVPAFVTAALLGAIGIFRLRRVASEHAGVVLTLLGAPCGALLLLLVASANLGSLRSFIVFAGVFEALSACTSMRVVEETYRRGACLLSAIFLVVTAVAGGVQGFDSGARVSLMAAIGAVNALASAACAREIAREDADEEIHLLKEEEEFAPVDRLTRGQHLLEYAKQASDADASYLSPPV